MGVRFLYGRDREPFHAVSNLRRCCENCQRGQCQATFSPTRITQLCTVQGDSMKICVENLKRIVRYQTSVMSAFVKTTNKRSEASNRVAYRLGVAGKPYSDGELVKSCIMDVVKCIHPGKETDYSLIPLSRDTVPCRQSNIA